MSPSPTPGSGRAQAQAAARIDRARIELRRGRAVLLQDAADTDALLVAAVETLGPASWDEFVQTGLPPQLLLTAERLQALGVAEATVPQALPLPSQATLAQLRALAALTPDSAPWTPPLPGAPADATMVAALQLAKRARLAPALLVAAMPAELARDWLHDGLALPLSTVELALSATGGPELRRVSDAQVPIAAHEQCTLVLYRELDGDAEHVAIVVGRPDLDQPVPVRLHSACLTGDLLGSLRCDCGDQLRLAIERLAVDGGVLLYLAQEGRGTGLASKLRAYRLQDEGLDTLQADLHLGFRADERDFGAAAAMLRELGIARIRLLTNNPHKIDALRAAGIDVVDRLPLAAPTNRHNARYVQTKQDHAGHWRPGDGVG